MILLISLVLDAGLILAELVKRRGKIRICRMAAVSALVNMSAFYLAAGLAVEFGYNIFLEIICAVTAKIFVVWVYVQGAPFMEVGGSGETGRLGRTGDGRKTETVGRTGKSGKTETVGRTREAEGSRRSGESKRLLPVYLLSIGVSLCVHSKPAPGLTCELLLLFYLLYSERYIRKQQQEREDSANHGSGGNDLYLQTIEDSYRKNRALMHDLNNHAIAMHALAVSGEYGKLVEYIDTFSQKVKDNMFPVHSGNIVLDALLADKYHRASGQGILVLFEKIRYSASLANGDLCTVVGNLFDNAIEENLKCRDAGQRRIFLSIVSEGEFLRIVIRNPLFHELKLKNGLPITEKPDAEHHGMGLRNVRRVCGRYGGTLLWDASEEEFSVTAELVMMS